jgi:aldehyde:ferredoxin oxidoreductase
MAMTGAGYFNMYEKPLTLPGIEVIKKIHCHGCPKGCWRTLNRSPSGEEGIRKCQNAIFYSLWSQKFQQTASETSFRATSLVDDYSLCVMEISFILIWLEKCFEQGILSEKDTGLSPNSMGSWEFLDALVKKLSYNEGFGKILAEGIERAAEYMGKDSKAIADAGRPTPYAPKVLIPSTLLYATETLPPITELHEVYRPLKKWALWYLSKGAGSYVSTDVLRRITKKFWGSELAADFSTCAGKALAAVKIQNREHVKESLILCDFVYPIFDNASSEDHVGDPGLESQLLSAVTGKEVDEASLNHAGERIFNLKRAILLREGRKGREDDILPESQYMEWEDERFEDGFSRSNPDLLLPGSGDEIISRKGKALRKEDFERMRDEYYQLRDWDIATGLLKKETLKKLDLSEVVDPLKGKVL